MANAWNRLHSEAKSGARVIDWRKKMSDNVAYALLMYTALQIFVTMGELHGKDGSILPYFALIVLVAAIIPSCRSFERRWAGLDDAAAADPTMAKAFGRDRLWLWLLAIGLPFLLTGLFKVMSAMFG